MKLRGRLVTAALAVLAIGMPTMLAGASTASAYSTRLIVTHAWVYTDNCQTIGDLSITYWASIDPDTGECLLPDSADGTVFGRQNLGKAVKVVVSDNLGMLAKLEFHPYGDKAWLYDTRNDGDGIYFQAYIRLPNTDTWVKRLPYTGVPGTSAAIDHVVIPLDLPEGTEISWSISDDAAGTHPIVIYKSVAGNDLYGIVGRA
jgi:hypothetical protein